MAKLQAPEGVESVTVGGKEIDVHEGVVEVAEEHVTSLLRHGFSVVKEVAKRTELHMKSKG